MDTEVLEGQEQEEEMIDISLGDADGGSGPADPEEPEEEEEGAGDGNGEENPPEDEPQPGTMSPEERHRQAAQRRAREDAERARAHQAAVDAAYARACAGQTDPYHGHRPILTESDYQAYMTALHEDQERQELEQLKESGLNPETLKQMIQRAVQENPAVRQADAAVQQANAAMQQMREAQIGNTIERELAAIRNFDPDIRTAENLRDKYPEGWDRTLELCQKGVSLSEAFKLANFDTILKSRGAAIRQGERNMKDSKAHLKRTKNNNQSTVTMPRAVLDEFRRINPGKTDAEYAAYWAKQHKNES